MFNNIFLNQISKNQLFPYSWLEMMAYYWPHCFESDCLFHNITAMTLDNCELSYKFLDFIKTKSGCTVCTQSALRKHTRQTTVEYWTKKQDLSIPEGFYARAKKKKNKVKVEP